MEMIIVWDLVGTLPASTCANNRKDNDDIRVELTLCSVLVVTREFNVTVECGVGINTCWSITVIM